MVGAGAFEGMVVARTDTRNVRPVKAAKRRILVRIIDTHGLHDTVFKSPDNLGIMVALAKKTG
jgi:hypothetical protein